MAEQHEREPAATNPTTDAGMAAELERVTAELAATRERLAATSDVLTVIGRSASDLEGVLETVVEAARRLCDADAGQIFLMEGGRYRLAYGSGLPSEYREHMSDNPVTLD